MSLNIVFAGTPAFASHILEALLETEHKILGVFTQPDRPKGRGQKIIPSPVKMLAQQHHLPVFQAITLKDPATQQILKDFNADVMVVVAYGLLLPKAILSFPKYGCINVHASLLPKWRGAAPIMHALLAGDAQTGVTIMQMDEGLDTGDMLVTKSYAIKPNDTAQTLHDTLATLGAEALIETLSLIENHGLSPEKQSNSDACYARKISKQDALIHWDKESAVDIERKVRAFNPWPICFFEMQQQTIRVFDATVALSAGSMGLIGSQEDHPPGTILQVTHQGIEVSTKLGIVRLLTLQLPGKKPQPVKDLINAHPTLFTPGNSLSLKEI